MSRSHHGTGSRSYRHQELLYDSEIPTPSHAERALSLAYQIGTGTLCTLTADPPGHPYGSFVTYALWENNPIFLISALAEHTQNLHGDARASLLVSEPGEGDPLARGRVTLVGSCSQLKDDVLAQAKAAYLEVHPRAKYFADYTDFSVWRLQVDRIRYIGGYGRMSWVEPEDWGRAAPDPITPHSAGILDHMNADHADALVAYCLAFSRATEVASATMVGIDRYGFEMSAETPEGPRPIRVAFDEPIASPGEARSALVALVQRAREAQSQPQES